MNWSVVRYQFDMVLAEEEKLREDTEKRTFDDIVDGVAGISLDKTRSYAKRLGADLASNAEGHAFVNGKHMHLDEVRFKFPDCEELCD